MKRWLLNPDATGLDHLVFEDAPIPEPGPGEVRVRVHAVSLNYRDHLILSDPRWRVPGRPLVPVSDGSGEIDAVGPGVSLWKRGDHVVNLYFKDRPEGPPHAGMGRGLGTLDEDGMLTEYLVLSAQRLTRAPAGLSHAEAATLPCAALTAWSALQGAHPVGPGQKVLVLGTGGVSLFALQFARALGAEVLATTSQASKEARLKAMGAFAVVNYAQQPDWGAKVAELTGGGVDKVVNAAGTGSFQQAMEATRPGGEIATMGLMTFGEALDPMLLLGKALNLRGVAVGSAADFHAMVRFIEAQGLKPPIAERHRFEDARQAYAALASQRPFGKVVIEVS